MMPKGVYPRKVSYCTVEGCKNRNKERGLCSKHWSRVDKYGDPSMLLIRAKGQGCIDGQRYLRHCIDGRKVLAHRLIMEQHIGRELMAYENVHHINGNRLDNRIENLEIWTKPQPSKVRYNDQIDWTLENEMHCW